MDETRLKPLNELNSPQGDCSTSRNLSKCGPKRAVSLQPDRTCSCYLQAKKKQKIVLTGTRSLRTGRGRAMSWLAALLGNEAD